MILSQNEQIEWFESHVQKYRGTLSIDSQPTAPKYMFDKEGRFIVKCSIIVIRFDEYTQMPIFFSDRCHSRLSIWVNHAKNLETLQGFPPLPNAEFHISNDNPNSVDSDTYTYVNIPDEQFKLVFDENNRNTDGHNRRLSSLGLAWLKTGSTWEEFKVSHKGYFAGAKYNI